MKVLIVAHPDDEIIWFSPHKPYAKLTIEAHPLRDRIILLGIEESGFWKDDKRQLEFQKSEQALYEALENLKKQFVINEIYTHNAQGEYGHDDHIKNLFLLIKAIKFKNAVHVLGVKHWNELGLKILDGMI